jgi:hypothetical protein
MATNFPASVDSLTNPVSNDSLNSPSHSAQHANANDAIEAIETYLLGDGASGLVLLNTTTFSAVTSVSVNNVFTSTYRNYLINLDNVFSATSEEEVKFRVRASGTDLTGSNYFYQRGTFVDSTAGAQNFASQTSTTLSNAINDGAMQVNITICNPQTANRTTSNTSTVRWSGGRVLSQITAAQVNNTSQYDGFTIFCAQNISGTIKVYGYK